ncbi:Herc2, partial [Symbiodinium pilosum]
IAEDERTLEDLRGIDVFAARQVEGFDAQGGDEDDESLSDEQNADDDATLSRAERLLRRRLSFDSLQLAALRRGLASVVPIHLLRLWRWQDLRRRVCGNVMVDLECLKQHTVYKNCADTDTPIVFLWQVLEGFSQQQRRSFLRFVWGRSSLPGEFWERNFTVQLLSGSNDSRLPSSHTCFFTLDLPAYSSVEICRERLMYCMSHCVTIDTDGAAARSMNWDEDEEELT